MSNKSHEPIIPALLTLSKAAARTGIKPETAERLAEHGEFPAVRRIGGRRYVGRAAFDGWLARVTDYSTSAV
jgi:excisionase family DNA binding protein